MQLHHITVAASASALREGVQGGGGAGANVDLWQGGGEGEEVQLDALQMCATTRTNERHPKRTHRVRIVRTVPRAVDS